MDEMQRMDVREGYGDRHIGQLPLGAHVCPRCGASVPAATVHACTGLGYTPRAA